ncbi:hypothetical protein OS21_09500 [Dickeya oryzae]
MKKTLAIIALSMSLQVHASITLIPTDSRHLLLSLSVKTQSLDVEQIKIHESQSFDIIENGKYIGSLIPAEGYYKKYNPLCFIGWSTDKKRNQ